MAIAPNGHIARVAGCAPSIYPDLYDGAAYAKYLALTPEQHVEYLSAWQDIVDGGISYTASVPYDSSRADIHSLFRLAWQHGVKGMSVYRDRSNEDQPCKVNGECGA